ncbi:MAG TPA: hypothetical protein VGY13_01780 [Solirubrobacteraceae bacterium]|nr:hypothetical protein [Solirubrobacteraceae bacterium]
MGVEQGSAPVLPPDGPLALRQALLTDGPGCELTAPGRLIDARLVRAELARMRAPRPATRAPREILSAAAGGR